MFNLKDKIRIPNLPTDQNPEIEKPDLEAAIEDTVEATNPQPKPDKPREE